MEDIVKISCPKCGKHLDVTELTPFCQFNCPRCNGLITRPVFFGDYHLLEICGIGGMAKVYRAIDTRTQKEVAVKIMDLKLTDTEIELKRFSFESELVAKIDHPGIVKIYQGDVHKGYPYLVMEYMKKGNLEDLQKKFLLPPALTLIYWLAIITDGLKKAFSFNIVHHDIKPANLMLAEEGYVKIIDFDLAKIHTAGETQITDWASLVYTSPERLYDGHEDYKGDIFSLGVTAYELLTGTYPFGKSGEVDDLIQRRKDMNFDSVRSFNSAVSEEISDCIGQMMNFNPELRPDYDTIIQTFTYGKGLNLKTIMNKTKTSRLKFWSKN